MPKYAVCVPVALHFISPACGGLRCRVDRFRRFRRREGKPVMFLFTWYRRLRLFIFRSQMRFGSWLVVKLRGDVGKYKTRCGRALSARPTPPCALIMKKCLEKCSSDKTHPDSLLRPVRPVSVCAEAQSDD